MHHTDSALALAGVSGGPRAYHDDKNARLLVPHPSGETVYVTIDPCKGLTGRHVSCKGTGIMVTTVGEPTGKDQFLATITCGGCDQAIVQCNWNEAMTLRDVATTIHYIKK